MWVTVAEALLGGDGFLNQLLSTKVGLEAMSQHKKFKKKKLVGLLLTLARKTIEIVAMIIFLCKTVFLSKSIKGDNSSWLIVLLQQQSEWHTASCY